MSDAQLELSRFVAPSRDCGSFRGDALRRLVPLTRRKWIQHDGRSWRSGLAERREALSCLGADFYWFHLHLLARST